MLDMKDFRPAWEANTVAGFDDHYKSITLFCFRDEYTRWNKCPRCHWYPKLWIFDNGRYATCGCFKRYAPKISATSIGEYYQKHKTLQGFDDDELRRNWNAFTEEMRESLEDLKLQEQIDSISFI